MQKVANKTTIYTSISIKKGVGSKICARQSQISPSLLDFVLGMTSSFRLVEPL
jgi:hypothetical protein